MHVATNTLHIDGKKYAYYQGQKNNKKYSYKICMNMILTLKHG